MRNHTFHKQKIMNLLYVYISLSVLKEPFNYLDTKAFAGKSTINHHDTCQKQSTGNDLIF